MSRRPALFCAVGSRWRRRTVLTAVTVAVALLAGPLGAPARADSVRSASWQLGFLNVAAAHRVSQGAGVTVAVIDTGVDPNHPDLRGNVVPGYDAFDVKNGAKGLKDAVGHGTGVAALIAGHGHGPGNRDGILGIAPKAKILPINVTRPGTRLIDPDMVGTAIRVAVDDGARVICVALSSSFSSKQVDAVAYAKQRGAVVVAPTGNRPDDMLIGSPASISGVVAVSSVDRSGTFSTTSVEAREVSVAAPGVAVPVATPRGGYRTVTGTSTAAALVAGAAALLRAKYPDEHPNRILQRLLWTTRDKGEPGRDRQYGWGVLDPVASLTQEPRQPGLSPTADAQSTGSAEDDQPVAADWFALALALLLLVLLLAVLAALTVALVVFVRRRGRRRRAAGTNETLT